MYAKKHMSFESEHDENAHAQMATSPANRIEPISQIAKLAASKESHIRTCQTKLPKISHLSELSTSVCMEH